MSAGINKSRSTPLYVGFVIVKVRNIKVEVLTVLTPKETDVLCKVTLLGCET
jgi:hypothetical protein